MYRKRNRLYARLEDDRQTGVFDQGDWLFTTTTLRPSHISVEDAYLWIKPAMAYAIQKVRKPREGVDHRAARQGRGGSRWRRAAWPGVSVEYMNDVDIQMGDKAKGEAPTRMPHIHALYFVRQVGDYLPSREAIARELHYYLNAFLYRKLQRKPLRWEQGQSYPYRMRRSVGYVHISPAQSTENCAMYMALHNGKIWTDGREYPPKYRRFATSRGFLPRIGEYETVQVRQPVKGVDGKYLPVDEWPLVQRSRPVRKENGWVFVKRSLTDVATRLAEEGLEPVLSSEDGEQVLSFSLAEAMTYPRVQWAIGTAPDEPDRRPGPQLHEPGRAPQLAPDVAEKMLALQAYWTDEGASWELAWHAPLTETAAENIARSVSFAAWERGESGLFDPAYDPAKDDPFWEPNFEVLSEYSCRWPKCSVADVRYNVRKLGYGQA